MCSSTIKKHFILFISMFAVLILMGMSTSLQSDDNNQKAFSLYDKHKNAKDVSIIIEVEADVHVAKKQIELYFPQIEIIETFSLLFNGLALKGPANKMARLEEESYVQRTHPVQTYKTLPLHHGYVHFNEGDTQFNQTKNGVKKKVYQQVNKQMLTGKGVKVAVIDTGVDYTHPDLAQSYKGGFDVVDLNRPPLETKEEEGVPTIHGTHVAGIIAANGNMQGIAPEVDLYAYRALGPGGVGSSVQVIAAMERAVRDGVHIINLSLGNTVNVPDYPTSIAVNEAVKHGVIVVVANGNAGPESWTIGSPATATSAFSVGAYESAQMINQLYEPKNNKMISLRLLAGSPLWDLDRDNPIVMADDTDEDLYDKIALVEIEENKFDKQIVELQDRNARAVLFFDSGNQQTASSLLTRETLRIPVAFITSEDANWLQRKVMEEQLYFQTKETSTIPTVAAYSSRGPVTTNWNIKPDIVAPGTNVMSTIPGGYAELSGTSMAAPYITGVIALLKEAKPNWTNEQILNALKTTAIALPSEKDEYLQPNVQGSGFVDIEKALHTNTILYDMNVALGKIDEALDSRKATVTIENISEEELTYYFKIPQQSRAMLWHLPTPFTVAPGETKQIELELQVGALQLDEGIHEGWLALTNDRQTFYIPYTFVNQTASYEKVIGFHFTLQNKRPKHYAYEFYVPERLKSLQVQLYDPHLLTYEGTLYEWKDLSVGWHEGDIRQSKIKYRGSFQAFIIAQLVDGSYTSYTMPLTIE